MELKEYPPRPEWGKAEMMDNIRWGNACREIDRENANTIEQYVLRPYMKLHAGKVGAHWLWVAITRIIAGEPEADVMADYGYKMGPHPPHRECGCADCAPSF